VNGEETTWSLHLFFKHKLFALLLFGPQGLHEGIRVTDWLLRFADGENNFRPSKSRLEISQGFVHFESSSLTSERAEPILSEITSTFSKIRQKKRNSD